MNPYPRGLLAVLVPTSNMVVADEGMWTFNNFPAAQVQQKHGFAPSAAWLNHLRLVSMRIAGGCSASVVSPSGLVMTNHHCARGSIENLSGLAKKDYNRDGFFAKCPQDEARCPGMACKVVDRAIQAHDGGTSNYFSLAHAYAMARVLRLADVHEEVHKQQLGRVELKMHR